MSPGELRAGLDPDVEGHILLALASGLSSDLRMDSCFDDRARGLLERQLASLT